MFTSLTEQPETNAMCILVWSDGPNRPIDIFLSRLAVVNLEAALYFVAHMQYIMKYGEEGLQSGWQLPANDPLHLIYLGRVWMLYFLEPSRIFICEQGFDDKPRIEIATNRMETIKKAENYER